MNIYFILILTILIGQYVFKVVVESLNVRSACEELPQEFQGYYDAEKYRGAQTYLKETTRWNLWEETFWLSLTLVFIGGGGFAVVDRLARSWGQTEVATGLIFAGIIMLGVQILQLPFSAYETFGIEARYGFNKMTVKTFIADRVKALGLGVILAGSLYALVIWFFLYLGAWAWIWAWGAVIVFQLCVIYLAPVMIFPLFNKFTSLKKGELKDAIEQYAQTQNFHLKGIFTIDGSRRSTKANAFFVGFGRNRRVGLYDTLIDEQTTEEVVSVLAHEIGHYKRGHILKGMILSFGTTGLMFYLLAFFIKNEGLFAAFGMEQTSVYASLFFFAFLYAPIQMLLHIASQVFSRRWEYEADRYAVKTLPRAEPFVSALKKLSVNHLSNLTPHPLKVFLDYSHPPVLNRIRAIRKV